jgi:hypothetical protein
VQTVFNLAWYELLVIFLILGSEGLIFAGYNVLGVGVQALNIMRLPLSRWRCTASEYSSSKGSR